MSKKRKRCGKQKGGNLDVNSTIGRVQGPKVVGIGADVSTPCTGNQKITTHIEELTGDETALAVGAVLRGCTEDES